MLNHEDDLRRPTMMRVETHHYTDGGAFEQSLDIYRPPSSDGRGGNARPVVALVVGTAWLGPPPVDLPRDSRDVVVELGGNR